MTGSTAPSGRPLTVGPPAGTHAFFPLAMPCVPKQAACRFTEKGGHFAWFGPGCAVPPPRVSPVSQTKGSTCWIAGERGDFLQKVPPFPRAPFPFQKLLPGRITGCTAPSGRPLTVGPPVGTHELFPLATPCVPKLAACRFTEKRRSFRLFLAGRHAAAASRFLAFLTYRRGTDGRGTPCTDLLPVILPGRFFAGWMGGTGGRKGAFLQKSALPSPRTQPRRTQRAFPRRGEGGQKRFEMYADSARVTRLCPKTHQP